MATVTRPGGSATPTLPSPLHELARHGQSVWIDDLSRRMLRGGGLARRVREEGIRGVTSNPAIFHRAIATGDEYDEQIRELAAAGRTLEETYEALVVADVREACDVLRPVFESAEGGDGFVSLEVSPYLVHDTRGSVEEARRLWAAVGRPNLFIKIPGTPAGVPAVEQLLFEGIHVNITLLFSLDAYEAVARAYLRALERRRDAGRSVHDVASVASFFLSRIDTLVDSLLAHRASAVGAQGPRPEALFGRAAVANAKLAYARFRDIFRGEAWERLAAAGAQPQRVLWASTSTKDPLYEDVRYVEPLVAPHTVNTMPTETIAAFADHGRARGGSALESVEEARRTLEELAAVGIDFRAVTWQLANEGAQKFLEPYDALMRALAEKRAKLGAQPVPRQHLSPAAAKPGIAAAAALHLRRFGRRLHAHDPALWSADPATAGGIAERLGWLDGDRLEPGAVRELEELARGVRRDGVRQVVLLGMGGSSLCPLVAAETFGPASGSPSLLVLDDTDPEAVREVSRRIDPARTLFLAASKSGTTIETTSLVAHFHDLAARSGRPHPGDLFIALTDPGTPLASLAAELDFRSTVATPPDVGGRYSALTPFGLLPMALLGVDVQAVLASARAMRDACDPMVPAPDSPGIALGAALGALARAGRDKLTIDAAPQLHSFPLWIEQLVAESTGKQGRGIVPVVGEPPAAEADAYGPDRVFVRVAEGDDSGGAGSGPRLAALEAAGHPVIHLDLPSREALGGEFLRWEIATAAAAAVLGVNPFDEPNVAEAKRATAERLETGTEESGLDVLSEADGVRVEVDRGAAWAADLAASRGVEGALDALLRLAAPGDYLALLAFFRATPERGRALAALRARVRGRARVATTLGHGPRYLHSTGQLHKGGPDRGVFWLLTADPATDVPIPGRPYGFAALHRAQALGDLEALRRRGRRIARIHLGPDVEGGLARLLRALG